MATNPARVTRAAYLQLWLAPSGSPIPVGLAVPAAPFADVGLTDKENTKFPTKPSFDKVEAHQTEYPVAQYKTGNEATLEVDLMEWSSENFRAVYSGGSVVEITPATVPKTYRWAPPKMTDGPLELVALLDVVDGPKKYRIVIPRCTQLEGVELGLKKSPNAILPLRLSVLGGAADTDPWYVITNDPAFAPAIP